MSVYLYCLRESAKMGSNGSGVADGDIHAAPLRAPAAIGGETVSIRAFEGIEAIVSAMNPDDLAEMREKAREDIHWIREKAVAHQRVVMEAMGLSQPVVPIRFGMIFSADERLATAIATWKPALIAAFERIRAKQEWGVKLFLPDTGKFENRVREQSDVLRRKSAEIAALPAGKAYFMEEELKREIEDECARRLAAEARRAYEMLESASAEATLVKCLDAKLTGRRERMALNAACLVAGDHLPEFDTAIEELREAVATQGLLLERSGPWPAYHFTELSDDGTPG